MNISADKDVWKTRDPIWLDKRLISWSTIQARLPCLKRAFHRKSWMHIKSYYVYGTPLLDQSISGINAIDRKLLELWLHPNPPMPGEVTYDKSVGSIVDLREQFRKMYNDIYSWLAPQGDAEYGVMGGRERNIMLDLNRGADQNILLDFGSGEMYPCCSSPFSVIETCLGDTRLELRSYIEEPFCSDNDFDNKYIANRRGLVLWDLASEMMMVDPDWLPRGYRSAREPLVFKTMETIIRYFDRPLDDESRVRKETAEFAEKLLSKFESREFSPLLMSYWDKTKESLKNGS